MNNFNYTSLSKLIASNSNEVRFVDNEYAHTIINDIIKKLIERINQLEVELVKQQEEINNRFQRIEEFATTELIGSSSLQYRPPGSEEYISLGQTLNDLYSRINTKE
jgi:uncharacterized protein (UPF0305 family)